MANDFFNQSHLPEPFNRAANPETEPEIKRDEPQFNYNPPELVPGGSTVPQINEVVREELSPSQQQAVREAQDRMDQGRSSDAQQRDGWNRDAIQLVEQEDRDRGLELEPEWDEQAQREYDRWALDVLAAEHDDKWGEHEAMDHAEEFQRNMDRTHEQSHEHDDFDHEH